MLTRSPTMRSYEDDDLGDDLPCVSLSQSTVKSEFEMPPASEVASLRAREETAERALEQLRESHIGQQLAVVGSLSRSASQGSTSGEEGEAALSAAVSALKVTEAVTDERPRVRATYAERSQLLSSMRDHFPKEEQFFDAYIQMLKDKPDAVNVVTEHILQGISSALISGQAPSSPGTCAWLLCVAVTTSHGLRVRRALHALLDSHASRKQIKQLAKAASSAMEDADQLLAACDAVRSGARGGADLLAARLLAHAMARVLPQQDPPDSNKDPPSPLSPETVALVRSSWRKLPTRAQLTLLRCAGRVLSAGDSGDSGDSGDRGDKGDMDLDLDSSKMDVDLNGAESIDNSGNMANNTGITNGTDGTTDTKESTRAPETEGGAGLLAALSQPLPRASAFDMNRQQVLTNVSKLQLLFGSQFSPKHEDTLNCSQTSIDSIDTPVKPETPIIKETPVKMEMKVKIPMKMVTPMTLDLKLSKKETPKPKETKSFKETQVKIKGTQLKLDGFFKQGTQVAKAVNEHKEVRELEELKETKELKEVKEVKQNKEMKKVKKAKKNKEPTDIKDVKEVKEVNGVKEDKEGKAAKEEDVKELNKAIKDKEMKKYKEVKEVKEVNGVKDVNDEELKSPERKRQRRGGGKPERRSPRISGNS